MPLPDPPVFATFLTIEKAARLAGVSAGRTLRRWLATGRLPYHQATAHILIRPHDLEHFLTRHEVSAPTQLDHLIDDVVTSLTRRTG